MSGAATVEWGEEETPPPPKFKAPPAIRQPRKNAVPESFETADTISPTEAGEAIRQGAEAAAQMQHGANGAAPAFMGRTLPHSAEAEEYLLSCCMLDGADVLARAEAAGVAGNTFYLAAHGIIYERLLTIWKRGDPPDVAVLAEDLKATKDLDRVGGFQFLNQVSSRMPTTVHAGYFIEKVVEQHLLRETIKGATRAVEAAHNFTGGIEEFLQTARQQIPEPGVTARDNSKSIADFKIPHDGDRSTLLGNRFLNRGDGMVISSTSSMGKSSMSLQMAVSWALVQDFHGLKGNGRLKSLIVQSEDSEGDIAEVWVSLMHKMELDEEDQRLAADNVIIETDRTHRGQAFIARLRRLVAKHKPDLVWINPLQAFMDGDVTDSKDLGEFLRSGLNSLNEPPTFGFIIVHHTTKPATGNDRAERLWHEVMYDMAGGAEIINWARAIMSLRATEKEGEFNLVLAKRGRRAGVTKQVQQGAGFREEIVTTIPLKHANEQIEIPGHKRKLNVIYWEKRAADEPKTKPGQGRKKEEFKDFNSIFPREQAKALPLAELHRIALGKRPISKTKLFNMIAEAIDEGAVGRDDSNPNRPIFWLKIP